MSSFDGWNEELYHWGILGMKHGVRRYQNPDGTWTEEGLALRRAREQKAEKRAAKKAAKLEKKAAKAASRAEKAARNKKLSQMTDEEVAKQISRLEMEKKYKELKGENVKGIMKLGADFATRWMNYKTEKANQQIKSMEMQLKLQELKTRIQESKDSVKKAREETYKQKQSTKQAEANAEKARQETLNNRTWTRQLEAKSQYKRSSTRRGYKAEKRRQKLIETMYKDLKKQGADLTRKDLIENYITLYAPNVVGGNNRKNDDQKKKK